MKVYLDTEFTQLRQPNKETKLISIGLVTADFDRSFYAELTDNYDISDCSDFVVEGVMPLLDAPELPEQIDYKNVYAKMTKAQCREHLAYWIAAIQEHVEINSDAPSYDWPLLTDLFKGQAWPINLFRECRNCYPSSINEFLYREVEEKLFNGTLFRRHHALHDAKVMAISHRVVEVSGRFIPRKEVKETIKEVLRHYDFNDPQWDDDYKGS